MENKKRNALGLRCLDWGKQINLVFEAAQRKKVKDRRQTEDVLKESENRLRVYRLVRWDIGGYPVETGVEIRRCLCGFTGWTKP